MSDAAYVTVADDIISYRASALGGCDMALLAARLGYDAVPLKEDAKIVSIFKAGHRIEDEVLDPLKVMHRQLEIVLPITSKIRVVGHIDGISSDGYLVEVKSQNQEEWDRFDREHWDGGFFPKYKWQVSSYMHGLTLNRISPVRLKLIRALRDENGQWTGETKVSHVDRPFYTVAEIRERILKIEAVAATGVLAAECTNSFPCPYFWLHEEVDRELISDESIDILAREYVTSNREASVALEKKKNAKRALREAIDKDKYRTKSGVKVTFYEASNPPQLDKELLTGFLEYHDRELDEFMKRSKSERLRVTEPREDDAASADDET